jgi:hypothetical protein
MSSALAWSPVMMTASLTRPSACAWYSADTACSARMGAWVAAISTIKN